MPELQDIFAHVHLNSMSSDQAKAFYMIRYCRTSSLGSHSEVCTECGAVDVSYNSCRNRNCPKCQHSVQEQWVDAQISNSRIQAFDGKSVSFSWKDYRDGNKSKVMTLDAKEFARRFLLHVLPTRFVKIRHYGIMCSRNISTKLSKCMKLIGKKPLKIITPKPNQNKSCRYCGSQNIILFFPKHSCAGP